MIFRTLKHWSTRWSGEKHYTFDAERTARYGEDCIVFADRKNNLLTIRLTTHEETRQLMTAVRRIDKAFADSDR